MMRCNLWTLFSSSRWSASTAVTSSTRSYKSPGTHKSRIDYPSVYQQAAEGPLRSARRRPNFKSTTGQRGSNTTLWKSHAECISDLAELEKPVDPSDPRAYLAIRAQHADMTPSIFRNITVDRFIRTYMKGGQKEKFTRIVNDMLYEVKRRQYGKWRAATSDEERAEIEMNPITIFTQALMNIRPLLRMVPVRRGGTTYHVPAEIPAETAEFRAMRWFVEVNARPRWPRWISSAERLATEVLDAYKGEGKVIKQKQELYRQCEANRAYAHYRTLK